MGVGGWGLGRSAHTHMYVCTSWAAAILRLLCVEPAGCLLACCSCFRFPLLLPWPVCYTGGGGVSFSLNESNRSNAGTHTRACTPHHIPAADSERGKAF